jgi:hypothetical protein
MLIHMSTGKHQELVTTTHPHPQHHLRRRQHRQRRRHSQTQPRHPPHPRLPTRHPSPRRPLQHHQRSLRKHLPPAPPEMEEDRRHRPQHAPAPARRQHRADLLPPLRPVRRLLSGPALSSPHLLRHSPLLPEPRSLTDKRPRSPPPAPGPPSSPLAKRLTPNPLRPRRTATPAAV